MLLAVLAAQHHGCIQRSATSSADGAPVATSTGAANLVRPGAPGGGPVDAALTARIRRWIAETPGAQAYHDAVLQRASEHDTPRARCVALSVRDAPVRAGSARVVCVVGDEVLAGEPGYQRFLQLHQFDAALARPAARVLIELRDTMLGFSGREYTRVDARAVNGALVIDVEARVTLRLGVRPAPGRWRVTINADGTATESAP